ncbi:molybdopterin-containing oxidoreductase family protein [Zhaonella formicivorans]|uniref:molybdopterin-containing oxidoreductase family protein n=1 Tax=Zhaonella formicivorans TaxID=2528593 RepID=UPI0010DED3E6|nr:molybdopterin-dependent oxidoreductase [Zhaonella formicivorans]
MADIRLTGCSQDCYDNCAVLAEVENGKLCSLRGNPAHPQTGSWLCAKGKAYVERVYHPDRILWPLRKTASGWEKISWEKAYSLICCKLEQILEQNGPLAILHYDDYGSSGALKALARRFFNALGGCTYPSGGLCLSAGLAAQRYDFGGNAAHDPEDILNSSVIVLWGRDPEKTNQHLLPVLKKAGDRGAKLVVINPLPVKTPLNPVLTLQPKPGTDGAIALAVANLLITWNRYDETFIKGHTYGFAEFQRMVNGYTPAWASDVSGIPVGNIESLACILAGNKPASFLLGWGLQRHANGGQTIRAIDALGALAGSIGVAGGGVNFANSVRSWNPGLSGAELAQHSRHFPYSAIADRILKADNPPIKAVFVTRANPACQLPNTSKVVEAFNSIEFKVVIDQFLTDTAQLADLVLPCTTYLEEDNLYKNSWHNMIILGRKVISPQGEAKPDEVIFSELAQRMGLGQYFTRTIEEWLEYAIEPLKTQGVTMERLSEGPVRPVGANQVAWSTREFNTPTGKFEFYSKQALKDGLPALPEYMEPGDKVDEEQYPLYLLTPHSKYRINSQFANIMAVRTLNPEPRLDIHPYTAMARGIAEGDWVEIRSLRGALTLKARLNSGLRPDAVSLEEGWWHADGACANFLTSDTVADMGQGSTFYDCRVEVRKKP